MFRFFVCLKLLRQNHFWDTFLQEPKKSWGTISPLNLKNCPSVCFKGELFGKMLTWLPILTRLELNKNYQKSLILSNTLGIEEPGFWTTELGCGIIQYIVSSKFSWTLILLKNRLAVATSIEPSQPEHLLWWIIPFKKFCRLRVNKDKRMLNSTILKRPTSDINQILLHYVILIYIDQIIWPFKYYNVIILYKYII